MGHFGLLNWIVVGAYFLGSFVLGSYFARGQKNSEDYLLAGRRMSWLPVALSIMATNTSAGSYMGVPTYIYTKNFMFYFNNITLLLITPLVIVLFLKFYYNLNLFTAYEYLEKRFNLLVRSIASILFIFLRLCWLAMMIFATSIALAEITGLSAIVCILVLGVGTSLYTMLGGMEGVIWTDVAQGIIFILGIFIVLLYILLDFNWNFGEIYSLAANAGRTRLFEFSFDPTVEVTFWGVLLGTSVINLASYGVDQVVLQRYLTAKDLRSSRRSIIVANFCIDLPFSTALYLTGICIVSYYQKHAAALPKDFDPNRVLPFFVTTVLPAGLSGIVIAGIMAATMSSISSGVNSITTATMVDFYSRFINRGGSSRHYLNMSRCFSLGWGLVATVLALFAGRLGTIAVISFKTNSFFTGVLLGIFILGVLTLRANWQGASLGALLGMAIVIYVGTMTRVSFLWYAPLGLVSTVALGYLLSLSFPQPDRVKLIGLVLGHGESGKRISSTGLDIKGGMASTR